MRPEQGLRRAGRCARSTISRSTSRQANAPCFSVRAAAARRRCCAPSRVSSRPTPGRIAIGASVAFDAATGTESPPEKRRLGMVFQSYALWPHLSVAENIAYPLAGGGLSKAEIAAKADAMLEWVGLGGMGGRYRPRAVGRPAAAGLARPRHGRQAARHPVRRAAVESRRASARAHAHGAARAAPRGALHVDLRHA